MEGRVTILGHEQNLPKGRKRLYKPTSTAQDEGSFRRTIAERIIRRVLEEIASNPQTGG